MDVSVLFLIKKKKKKGLIAPVTKGRSSWLCAHRKLLHESLGTAMNNFIFQWKAQTRN